MTDGGMRRSGAIDPQSILPTEEDGNHMASLSRDQVLIMGSAFLRALATGMAGGALGLYLARLHFTPGVGGRVVGAGLSGAALASLFAALRGDRHGRRRTLIEIAVLGTVGGALAASASGAWPVTAAAFL